MSKSALLTVVKTAAAGSTALGPGTGKTHVDELALDETELNHEGAGQNCAPHASQISISGKLSNNVGLMPARKPSTSKLNTSRADTQESKARTLNSDSKMQSPEIPDKEASSTDISVDQKLVARVQKGDKKAFDLLVVKYQSKVASIVSRYVNDYHEIADVTQEAFIKAYKALKGFRGDSAFYTWLYRIAINCAKNHLIAKGRRPPASDIDMNEAEHFGNGKSLRDIATPESLLNKEQLESQVKIALGKLPEDLRVALTLREFEGLSYDEIAGVMACPVGTVRSRIFRAREFVDQAIQDVMEGV